MPLRNLFRSSQSTRSHNGNPFRSSNTSDPSQSFREAGDRRLNEGDFVAAINFYNEAIRLSPTDEHLLLSRAVAHRLSGPASYRFALNDANTAIQCRPESWRAWDTKGDVLAAMDSFDEAEEAYQNAIGCAPVLDRPKIQSSLAQMRARRASATASTPSRSLRSTAPVRSSDPPQEMEGSTSYPSPVSNRSPVSSVSNPTRVSPRTESRNLSPQQQPAPAPVSQTRSRTSFTPNELVTMNEETPAESPPSYSASSPPPAPATAPPLSYVFRLGNLTLGSSSGATTSAAMTAQNRGKLSLRIYTASQNCEGVQLLYLGLTRNQLTTRELDTSPKNVHPSHGLQYVDTVVYPGNNFLDKDGTASVLYTGMVPGTTTISGYSLEYRLQQMALDPNLQMESLRQGLPRNQLADIVRRLKLVQKDVEDNEGLAPLLGMSQIHTLQCGFGPNGRAQDRIDNLCYMITRTYFDEPDRFIDFSTIGNFTKYLKEADTQQDKLRDFLFQILLGFELFIRLGKQILPPSYASIITSNISCMIVAANQFKSNVEITEIPSVPGALASSPKYKFKALKHNDQAEGLMKFAETMQWPFLSEARRTIDTASRDVTSGNWPTSAHLTDWLFGLVLPGKMHGHLLMCALVQSSPSISHFGPALYYDNGLVLHQQGSYWPQRTPVGRVLGGARGMKHCCGWIGPAPAPRGNGPRGAINGWVFVSATKTPIPTPLVVSATEVLETSYTDPNSFTVPTPPGPVPNHRSSVLRSLNLDLISGTQDLLNQVLYSLLVPQVPPESYRASLDFEIDGAPVRYTLYQNPIFVTAPPCVGTHPMPRTLAEQRLRSVVSVAALRATVPETGRFIVINALGEGDETVARAWCAEHGKNAVVRRNLPGAECCFTCACTLAAGSTGLNVHVLIWSV